MPKVRTLLTRWIFKGDSSKLKKFNRGLKMAKRTADTAGKALIGMGKYAKLAGLAFVGAAAGLAVLVKKEADAADAIGKNSRKLGISVELYQRLGHAAELSGLTMDKLIPGLKRLSAAAYDAANGSKESEDAFAQLGITVKDAGGNLKDTEGLLWEAFTALGQVENNTLKVALAQKVFGRSGVDLLPMLSKGADGLAAMMAEADKLGIVMNTKTITAAEDFNDMLLRVKQGLRGVTQGIAGQLFPALTKHLEKVKEWIVAHQKVIQTKVAEYINRIVKYLKSIDWKKAIKGAMDFVGELKDIVTEGKKVLDFLGGFKFLVALAFGVATVSAIGSVVTAVKALSAALAVGMGMAAAITGLIGVLIALGAYMIANWDDIADQWQYIWKAMGDAAYDAIGWIADTLADISKWFGSMPDKFKADMSKMQGPLGLWLQGKPGGVAAGPAGAGGTTSNVSNRANMGGLTQNITVQGNMDQAAARRVQTEATKGLERANRALMEGLQR